MKDKTVALAYHVAVVASVFVAIWLWFSSDQEFSFPSLLALLFVWFLIKTVFVYVVAWLFH